MKKDYKYLIRVKNYFSEADQLITKLKEIACTAPYEARLDLGIQIEEVKIKRVELQLRMDRAWRDTEKSWGFFKKEFEKDNKVLVQKYRKIVDGITANNFQVKQVPIIRAKRASMGIAHSNVSAI